MKVIEMLRTYVHTPRRTWLPGDRPVVDTELAAQLVDNGDAKLLGDGCGCPGMEAKFDDTPPSHTRGVTQDEIDAFTAEQEAETDAFETAKPPTQKAKNTKK